MFINIYYYFFPTFNYTYVSYLTTEAIQVKIAVEDDDSDSFLVASVTRHYRKTADGAAGRKFSTNTHVWDTSVTLALQSLHQLKLQYNTQNSQHGQKARLQELTYLLYQPPNLLQSSDQSLLTVNKGSQALRCRQGAYLPHIGL